MLKQLKFEIFGHIPLFYIPLPPLENIYLCNPLLWNSSNFHSDHDLRRDPRVDTAYNDDFSVFGVLDLKYSQIWPKSVSNACMAQVKHPKNSTRETKFKISNRYSLYLGHFWTDLGGLKQFLTLNSMGN